MIADETARAEANVRGGYLRGESPASSHAFSLALRTDALSKLSADT